MFSTALATMKFLSDTRPMIGFSSLLGTGTFLSPSRMKSVSRMKRLLTVAGKRNVEDFQRKRDIVLTLRENHSSSSLLSEIGGIRLHSSLWLTHMCSERFAWMVTSAWVVLTVEISNVGLRGCAKSEGGACGRHFMWVLRFVHLLFRWHVLLLRNQVVDALLVLHLPMN